MRDSIELIAKELGDLSDTEVEQRILNLAQSIKGMKTVPDYKSFDDHLSIYFDKALDFNFSYRMPVNPHSVDSTEQMISLGLNMLSDEMEMNAVSLNLFHHAIEDLTKKPYLLTDHLFNIQSISKELLKKWKCSLHEIKGINLSSLMSSFEKLEEKLLWNREVLLRADIKGTLFNLEVIDLEGKGYLIKLSAIPTKEQIDVKISRMKKSSTLIKKWIR